MPMKVDMLFTINDDTFFLFMKNIWIEDSGALCLITNNSTSVFYIINIDKLIQGGFVNMLAMKKGMLYIKPQQVDGIEWVHPLWPVNFCPKAGANMFSLTCKIL